MEYPRVKDARLLADAVAQLRAAVRAGRFADADRAEQAVVWALGAAASTLRARTVVAEAGDLDRAVDWGQRAADA
jgi:hypothetical protein